MTTDLLEKYLTVLAVTEAPAGWTAPIPSGDTVTIRSSLRTLLDDPRALRELRDKDPEEQFRQLAAFALWLEDLPSGVLPAELVSRTARFRFLVWSLRARLPDPDATEVVLGRVEQAGNVNLNHDYVLQQARAAREDWLSQLKTWEDDPWLAARQASHPRWFETELRRLTETWPDEPGSRPLTLVADDAPDTARTEDHQRVAADISEAHWLPRGSLLHAARAFDPGRGWSRWIPVALPIPPLIVIVLFVCGQLRATPALLASLGSVFALLFLGAFLPIRRDALLVLRLPAAVGAGAVALLSFTPRWWLAEDGWQAGVALLVAAYAYLLVETRLHGVDRRHAVGRATLLGVIGAAYAFVLCLAVLTVLAPAVAEQGQCLVGWWHHDPWSRIDFNALFPTDPGQARTCRDDTKTALGAAPANILVLMTGWSLAVGLALQILWDDRPVTAPLGRLRRVRGGQP